MLKAPLLPNNSGSLRFRNSFSIPDDHPNSAKNMADVEASGSASLEAKPIVHCGGVSDVSMASSTALTVSQYAHYRLK